MSSVFLWPILIQRESTATFLAGFFSGLGPCFRGTFRYDERVLGLCKVFMAVISFRLSPPSTFLSSSLHFNLQDLHVTVLARCGSICVA
jgi:hypothetical protein